MKRERICGIYTITNKINGKIYVGQSVDILKRFGDHKRKLSANSHINQYLQSSVNKYGIENFEFAVYEQCDRNLLNEYEILTIRKLNTMIPNGYNLTSGGDGNCDWTPPQSVIDANTKPVICLNTLQQYKGCKDASKQTGIAYANIMTCCQGKNSYASDCNGNITIWAYEEDYNMAYDKNEFIRDRIERANYVKGKFYCHHKSVVRLNDKTIFSTMKEAALVTGIKNPVGISMAVREPHPCAGHDENGTKYAWRTLEDFQQMSDSDIEKAIIAVNSFDPSTDCNRQRPVICLNTMSVYQSVGQASNVVGVNHGSISDCCSGKLNSVGRFNYGTPLVFMYLDDFIDEELTSDEIEKLIQDRTKRKYCGRDRAVICVNTNECFNSAKEAAEYYGIKYSTQITSVCRGKTKTAGQHPQTKEKLIWKYATPSKIKTA